AVHHIFHAEHNLRVGEIKDLILEPGGPAPADWQLPNGDWSGERLFQAARFVTEMQYQHLVFEEFARKIQPQVNVFAGYNTDIDPAIVAEFAHTVYRFGHSMLTETVARKNADGSDNDLGLIQAFLNPLAFNDGGSAGQLSPRAAAGSIVRGMTAQVGNEIDEFVTGALRNNLVGLPLDLATINIARGREAGVPSLNDARRQFFAKTNDSALRPYTSWNDFKAGLKHEASLVNFVAAYGNHPTITGASTVAAKRAAAKLIVEGGAGAPADRAAFLNSAASTSGVDDIDFWIGGLAEKQMPFGGMLGSSFNFVFETQMEKLQDGDRFYYLSRTAGLHFLTQLEENSFAELVMRTTDTTHLPFDVFSRPDFTFELERLGDSGPVADDPRTDYDESELLTRTPEGTLRFSGPEHVVFGGTAAADKVHSSEGDDTLWGDEGNDRLEGGAGNDALSGGEGDDILTDLFGDDNIKGGEGDDAINGGGGFDLILAGVGSDFVVAGADPKETFAGDGDDFVIAGDSSDVVFANAGNDWVEGGAQADTLDGDDGDPFELGKIGDDVLIGDSGDDELHGEGGDDILVMGPGIERNEGMLGFDWVIHRGDPQAANADMNRTIFLPPDVNVIRDRFGFVEGLSGWDKDDILRGNDLTAADMVGHELKLPGRITGLADLLGGASSFTGGNVILGGRGSDLIEGRGGNDVIDGDAWLNVRLSVREAGNPAAELKSVDSMKDIQEDVFAGRIKPSQIRVVREIETPAAGPDVIDTAVFSDVRANYDFVPDLSTSQMTVVHARGTLLDGTDTVRNVERLAFADQTVEIAPIPGNGPATGTVQISDVTPDEGVELTARRAFDDPDGVDDPTVEFAWQVETAPGSWVTSTNGVRFTPGNGEAGLRLRVVATFQDGDGVFETVRSEPSGAVGNVNDRPTGRPVLSNATPRQGQAVTALTGSIADLDGLAGVTFRYQWQQRVGVTAPRAEDIAGATRASFTPTLAQLGKPVRVVVSFTDNGRTVEQVVSSWSSEVAAVPSDPALIPPDLGTVPAPPPAQAQAPSVPAAPVPGRRAVRPRKPLNIAALSVPSLFSTASKGPITLAAKLPRGARVIRIRVFRLGDRAVGRRIATVLRKTRNAGWHRFRLTESKLRHLPPGRYAVEVRAGRSRADLGPAKSRPFTVKKLRRRTA
ncbi:MAG TPA: peroxidase family protein, partial [Solirubrobacteraceae bacterium]